MRASEFRKDMKKYLDAAVAGQEVYIERGGIKVDLVPRFPKAIVKTEAHQQDQGTSQEAESQNVIPKRYAVVCDVMGLQHTLQADLSHEDAENFIRENDINGEMSIIESDAKPIKQPKRGRK